MLKLLLEKEKREGEETRAAETEADGWGWRPMLQLFGRRPTIANDDDVSPPRLRIIVFALTAFFLAGSVLPAIKKQSERDE